MMRKIGENRRAAAGVLLFAGAVFFAGCGAENGMGQAAEREQSEMAENPETVPDSGQEGQAETDAGTMSQERAQELLRAQTRHCYGGILSQVMAAWRLPDMELGTGTADGLLDAAESDSYVELGSLRAWDDGIEGWELPDGLDVDGDGTVYEIQKAGEEYQAYEGFRFNKALDGGNIGYRGEKLEDVTIFGIYPGISVDGAWEKLQAYGFYAASYPEVENCLVTGDGFGNISIWFSAEDNVVTDITVRPYCAFAG